MTINELRDIVPTMGHACARFRLDRHAAKSATMPRARNSMPNSSGSTGPKRRRIAVKDRLEKD
jgi:hypothetical protein